MVALIIVVSCTKSFPLLHIISKCYTECISNTIDLKLLDLWKKSFNKVSFSVLFKYIIKHVVS